MTIAIFVILGLVAAVVIAIAIAQPYTERDCFGCGADTGSPEQLFCSACRDRYR